MWSLRILTKLRFCNVHLGRVLAQYNQQKHSANGHKLPGYKSIILSTVYQSCADRYIYLIKIKKSNQYG